MFHLKVLLLKQLDFYKGEHETVETRETTSVEQNIKGEVAPLAWMFF